MNIIIFAVRQHILRAPTNDGTAPLRQIARLSSVLVSRPDDAPAHMHAVLLNKS